MSTTITGDGSTGLVVGEYTVPAAGDFVTGAGLQVAAQGLADDLQVAYGFIVPGRTVTRQFRSEAFAFGATAVWDFDLSNPSVWTDQTTPGTTGYIYFPLDAPSHSILVGVTAEILPAGGHGGLPGTKPRIALRKVVVSTNTVSELLASDAPAPASVAAYEAQHSFGLAPTGSSTAWATSTAYVVGDFRTANARLYMCIFAGTSASSGTGPNEINGKSILDGTCVWAYAGGTTGYVLDRSLNRYYVQFGSEGGANQVAGLQLVGLRATYTPILTGFGE